MEQNKDKIWKYFQTNAQTKNVKNISINTISKWKWIVNKSAIFANEKNITV